MAAPLGLTKHWKKKLEGNYTRMLCAVLKKSWKQKSTKQQLYSHLFPITQTIQVRQAKHAGHWWRRKNELLSDTFLWTTTHGHTSDDQPTKTYIHQLSIDIGCHLEDLPRAMINRNRWPEEVNEIHTVSLPWW